MEPQNLHPSSRNSRQLRDATSHHIPNGNHDLRMPVPGLVAGPSGAPSGLEHLHAAEVLASFQQYPIRATVRNGIRSPPQTTFGNSSLPTRQHVNHQQPPRPPRQHDPLLQDMQAHSRDLDDALQPILRTPDGAPGTDYDLSNCRGVRGIGGATVPPGTDGVPVVHAQSYPYVTPSPTAPSQSGSGNDGRLKQELYVEPTIISPKSESNLPKADKEEFKTTFQFVVNEDAKEARNTVRKHVMREYRRRERWEQGQKGPPEKKPTVPAPKKRRRKQGNSAVDAEQAASQGKVLDTLPDAPLPPPPVPGGEATGSVAQKGDGGPKSPDSSGSGCGSSDSRSEGQAAQDKKKLKLLPPVFADSKQHQLWGAVATDYDDAIAELQGNKAVPYTGDPWAGVAVNEIDPFSRLKLELGPATSSLLHHFAWVMPSLMDEIVTGKVFHRLGWLYSAVAIHDPTPVHVILGYTLGHVASLRGIEEPPLALEHKSKAIKLLHSRMSDPAQCYSDGLIGAIVNFAGWELICANPKAYAMHMSGLARIIAARGGMSAFADNGELETVLVRLDAIRAYVSISAPRYPAFTSVRALPPLAIAIPPSPHSLWSPNSQYTPFEYRYCSEALTIMNMLEDVLLLARSAATDLTGPIGVPFKKLLSSSLTCLLEKPNNSVLSPPTPTSGGSSNPAYNGTDLYASLSTPAPGFTASQTTAEERRLHLACKSLRLAALAFLDAAIREFFDSPPQPGYYTNKLKLRFLGSKALANDSPWGRSLEMVIAVLLQADRMALERPWRAWYMADALTLTMRIGEWTWEMVVGVLRKWVKGGGLDQDEEVTRGDKERGLEAPGKGDRVEMADRSENTSGSGGEGEKIEKRSVGVWDLKKVAERFLREWDAAPDDQVGAGAGAGLNGVGVTIGGSMPSIPITTAGGPSSTYGVAVSSAR